MTVLNIFFPLTIPELKNENFHISFKDKINVINKIHKILIERHQNTLCTLPKEF